MAADCRLIVRCSQGHVNMVELVAVVPDAMGFPHYLVTERAVTNLFTLIHERPPHFDPPVPELAPNADLADAVLLQTTVQMLSLLADIARGLEHIHCLPLAHRDLSAKNVLLRLQGYNLVAMLTDLGAAKDLRGRLTNNTLQPGAEVLLSG